jgi:hypothetical protein
VKSFWNYINSKLKTRSGIGTLERSDGTLASSEADKVEVFTRTEDLQNVDANCNLDIHLSDIVFSQQDIVKRLNSLKTDNSAGPDGLHLKVLFEVHDSIYYPLFLFFNKSIEEGKVPAKLKKAIVCSIFKNQGSRWRAIRTKKSPCEG